MIPKHPNIITKFFHMCRSAVEVEQNNLELDMELEHEKILQFILRHSEAIDDFQFAFIELIDVGINPDGMIEFCMHELRYESVKGHLEKYLDVLPRGRAFFYFEDLLKAFDDDWVHAELYRRFEQKTR